MEWSMKSAGARFLAGAGLLAPLGSGKNEIQASLISSPSPARLRLPPPIFLLAFVLAVNAGSPSPVHPRTASVLEQAVAAGPRIRDVVPSCAKPGDDPDDYGHHGHGRGHGHHHHKPPHGHKGHD
jgi:hypothetical protein